MADFKYALPDPETLSTFDGASIRDLVVDFERREVRLIVDFRDGARAVQTTSVVRGLAAFDSFVSQASSLPGTAALEKLLAHLPDLVAEIPEGGTVEEVASP